jgi:hypothetical protein
VSYNGYYVTFPRLRRGFDSLHPQHVVARLAVVSPAVFRFTACPVLSACGLGTTPSTRSTLAGATSHVSKCYQLTHKAIDLKACKKRGCSADDAEVVPPDESAGPPQAETPR